MTEDTLQQILTQIRESRAFGEIDMGSMRDKVCQAMCNQVSEDVEDEYGSGYCYVCEVFPSFVVASTDKGYVKQDYSWSEAGGVKLGAVLPVERSWIPAMNEARRQAMESQQQTEVQPIRESQRSAPSPEAVASDARPFRWQEVVAAFSEATFEDGVIKGVVPIRPGESKNRRFYPKDVLKRDHRIFEGMPSFYDHQDPKEPKPLRNLLGVLENARWDESAGVPRADLRYPPTMAPVIAEIKEKFQLLGAESVGLSIDMDVKAKVQQVDGRVVQSVEGLLGGFDASTDVVFKPSAGGGFDRAFEATQRETQMLEGLEKLTLDELKAARPDLFKEPLAAEEKAVEVQMVPGLSAIVPPVIDPAKVQEAVNTAVAAAIEAAERSATFRAKVAESKLPDFARQKMLAEAKAVNYEEKACEALFSEWSNFSAAGSGGVKVQVPGAGQRNAHVTETFDVKKAALMGAVQNSDQELDGKKVARFTSLRQAMMAFHPEMMSTVFYNPGQFARECMDRLHWSGGELSERLPVMEAITTGTFDQAWADVMHRSLMMEVADPELNLWRMWVSDIISFPDLTNTMKLIRIGDYGNIASVAEGGTYQAITSPADEQVSFAVSKYGNTEAYTFEAALRDDLRALARIPKALGRAWAWTVHDAVYSTILQANTGTGATCDYDSTVLYHANHSNIATSTYTAADLITAAQKIRVQTALSSGKIKNYRPRFLLYQNAETMKQVIWETVNSDFKQNPLSTSGSQVNLPNYIKQVYGLEAIEVNYPTATSTRWEVVADPRDCQTAAVGFLNGRQDPELWVQDMDRVGSVFSADQITYKLRGTFGCDVLDHRSFARGNL